MGTTGLRFCSLFPNLYFRLSSRRDESFSQVSQVTPKVPRLNSGTAIPILMMMKRKRYSRIPETRRPQSIVRLSRSMERKTSNSFECQEREGEAIAIYFNFISSLLSSFGKVLLTELRGSQNYYAVKVDQGTWFSSPDFILTIRRLRKMRFWRTMTLSAP